MADLPGLFVHGITIFRTRLERIQPAAQLGIRQHSDKTIVGLEQFPRRRFEMTAGVWSGDRRLFEKEEDSLRDVAIGVILASDVVNHIMAERDGSEGALRTRLLFDDTSYRLSDSVMKVEVLCACGAIDKECPVGMAVGRELLPGKRAEKTTVISVESKFARAAIRSARVRFACALAFSRLGHFSPSLDATMSIELISLTHRAHCST